MSSSHSLSENPIQELSARRHPPEGIAASTRQLDVWMFGVLIWELYTHSARSRESLAPLYTGEVFPFHQIQLSSLVSSRE